MQLRALRAIEYHDLFTLMKEESFPDTPQCFYEAKKIFSSCLCYGKFSKEGQLNAAFVFGEVTNENAFIDVVCRNEMRGKWATKKTIKWIFNIAFSDLNLSYIWINPKRMASLKMASQIGFKHVHGLEDSSLITMLLSKENALKKYN